MSSPFRTPSPCDSAANAELASGTVESCECITCIASCDSAFRWEHDVDGGTCHTQHRHHWGLGWVRGWWHGCHEKWAKHREMANAPPWPKFHPVPVEPAFTPRASDWQPVPNSYGHFGTVP
ncbi:MAG: hypothetical protein MUF23_10170 [Pirellula sp.]|nr:hypothetical protein [Pirellula sp.]